MASGIEHALEQALGTVEHAGLQVVPGEFQQCVRLGSVVQIRPGDQVLVQADGAFDFAAPAQQVAKDDIGFDRIGVQVDHIDEQVDGLVRLLVEQVVDALEVMAWNRLGLMTLHVASRRPPAGQRRDRQQEPEQGTHEFKPRESACAAGCGLPGTPGRTDVAGGSI